MSTWLMLVVFACYTWTGVMDLLARNWWAGVWFSYAASMIFILIIRMKGLPT